MPWYYPACPGITQHAPLVPVANQRQDEEEEVDDVQVEVEGCEDVLLRREGVLMLPSHHQLRVKHQILQQMFQQ